MSPQPSESGSDCDSTFPSLKYDIASKKRSITIAAIIIFLINGLIPAVVYYILQYGTSVSRSTVINVCQISSTLSALEWPWRLYILLRRNGERAPQNRSFLTLDFFQWCFLFGIILVTIFIVVATMFNSMRWFMFGFVALFGVVAIALLLTWILAYKEVSIPIQMSSLQSGTIARPAIYFLIEDLTACDGGAGQAYRERLNIRWESSPLFRKLLMDLTLLPAIGFLIQTGLQFVILFVASEVVYVALSTAVLWGWFALTLLWGWKYAEKGLRKEKDAWHGSSKSLMQI